MTEHDHHQDNQHEHQNRHADGADCSCETSESILANTTAIDPVCGMTVEKEVDEHVATYQGRAYYFCSSSCRTLFFGSPSEYVSA